LADRGFLISEEVDELRRIRRSFGQAHYRTDRLELILLSSEDCNFRCSYCYEDFTRGTMRAEVRDSIKALLRKRAPTIKQLSVGWFGGEPLYGWEAVRDLAPHIQAFCLDQGIKLTSHMTTNGYLLTPDIASQLLSWDIRRFQISLDGVAADHDCRRQGRDGSPTFERIFANLKALHQTDAQFTVSVRMNFDLENGRRLEPLLDLLRAELERDPRFMPYFFAVERWGGANDANLAVCGWSEGHQIHAELMRAAMDRDMNVGEGVKDYDTGGGVCYAARPYSFIVGASGKLMKCTVALDKEDYNVVGELTMAGDVVLDPDKMALWTNPAFEDDKVCRQCHVLPLCQGLMCPLERIQHGQRECMPVKGRLHDELVRTIDIKEKRAQ
jgi:uncharacterized protein